MEARFWLLTLTPLLALVSYLVLLTMVLRRGVSSQLQRYFAFYLFAMAVWSVGSAMQRLDPHRIVQWNQVTTGSFIVMWLTFFAFVQVFLHEERKQWLLVGSAIVVCLEIANALGFLVTDIALLPGGLLTFELRPLGYLMSVCGAFFLIFAIALLWRARRRTSDPVLSNRIRYPLIGGVVVLLGALSNLVDALSGYPIDHLATLVNACLLAYAVLRYQLVDISLVLRKGLLYSIPTALIGATYFLIVSVATLLFNAVAGPQLLLVSLIVAAITAVAAQPLRDRAQLWIDRLFFREKYDSSLMLQRLSGSVASVLDLDSLTGMILEGITSTMHIQWAGFCLREEGSGAFRLGARCGLERDVDLGLREDHPLVIWFSDHEKALTRAEMDMIPQFKALWETERRDLERIGAELFVPLRAKGGLVGILTLGPKLSEAPYSEDDRLTLTTLANQTATALENARLHEESRRRNRELVLLNRVIAASASDRGLDSILQTVCQELIPAFDVSRSAIALFNREKTEATVMAVFRAEEPSAPASGSSLAGSEAEEQSVALVEDRIWSPGRNLPVGGNPLFQYLLKNQVPLAVDEPKAGSYAIPVSDLMVQHGLASLLALPLFVDGEVMGGLFLGDVEPHPFSPQEIGLAQRVAEQVSGALARGRLAETQQRLSTAVEQSAEAVMITDTEGTILYVNPAFEQISGYSRLEALGHTPRILKSGKQDDLFYRNLWQTITEGRMWHGRFTNRKQDGTLYLGDTTITPVRNQSGELINYVDSMRDVTREVQLEEQFHRSQKMEALGRLAGGIAHDFNNLLTVILLSTRLVQRRLGPESSVETFVQQIQKATERAADLTKQLLRFSRREIIELQLLDLNQLVSDLSQMLRSLMGEDIEFVMALAENPWLVRVDPAQIEQVIMNLVVNARDAMPGGGALTIETANAVFDEAYTASHPDIQPGRYLMLAVKDTGVGMEEEVKAHLFEPFFTTKEPGRGTGLGLSTVFGIVKQNKGQIVVDSEVGQGTTFRIYLPCAEVKGSSLSPRAFPPGVPITPRGSETILLVEDAVEVLRLEAEALSAQGYRVLTAGNGLEALEVSKACNGFIDLLITDLVMPKMGGVDLVEQLRPQRPGMQVLYVSAYADRPLVEQIMAEETVAFLGKPFTVEDLNRKVRTLLEDRA
jgi:PAS domain S-box-containing protein